MTSPLQLFASCLAIYLLLKVSTAAEAGAEAPAPSEELEDLSGDYYRHRCPQYEGIIRSGVEKSLLADRRNAASLLRLFFHDCFVDGCDASILLDDTPACRGEKTAGPNDNSARGFDQIDMIKEDLEQACPGVFSCADLLAVIARDAVYLSGGPFWEVTLGRRDSLTASFERANQYIPQPDYDYGRLLGSFEAVGLDWEDLLALVGAHTIGFARCTSFVNRLYNETFMLKDAPMSPGLRNALEGRCPRYGGNPDVLEGLDQSGTVYDFDNGFYQDIKGLAGVLHSDQTIWSMSNTMVRDRLETYSKDYERWSRDFTTSIIKMGNIKPLLWPAGEIRRNCRKINA